MAHMKKVEVGLNLKESRLSIYYPLAVMTLSPRGAQHPMLGPQFEGVTL
jgi:hypothetical protein